MPVDLQAAPEAAMSLGRALQNAALLSSPAAVYAVAVRLRAGLPAVEIASRLGFGRGDRRTYAYALAAAVPAGLLSIAASSWTAGFKGSMIGPYVGASPTAGLIAGVFFYGFLATGFPEELLFRGLVAGALFRRVSFWKANFLQAFIFMLPHLLILLIAPRLWPLVVCVPFGLALVQGWLRETSGSIWPGVIVHAVSNTAGALAVMRWR
jgi:membrane protease YdiL (CAAX protease family)